MSHTRVTALWTGVAGLPGYTRLSFNGALDEAAATACANRVRAFFDNIKGLLPPGVVISFSEVAQVFNAGGQLTGEVAVVPPPAVAATGTGAFAAPVGAVVQWITGVFINGRRVRGRTFLVPLASSAFAVDGTPGSTTLATIGGAANTLQNGVPALVIAGGIGEGGGYEVPVTGASVPDRAAVLRSRRD